MPDRADTSGRDAADAVAGADASAADHSDRRELLSLMSLATAVQGRASVRRWLAEPVPGDHVEAMVALAVRAANAGNSQPWRFIAVQDAALREAMRGAVHEALDEMAGWPELEGRAKDLKAVRAYATFFADAPLAIAVFALPYVSRADELLALRGVEGPAHDRLRQRPDLQSVGAAVQLLITAAHTMGYGACWMSAPVLAAPRIEALLGVEPPAQLAAVVPIGMPAGRVRRSPRRPLGDVLSFR